MVFTRTSVWANNGDFNDRTLLWYARGINILQQRPIDDPTSWRFIAAIHGFHIDLWKDLGYFTRGEQLPTQAIQQSYWNQCQHQTWYFLPWHRGYLASLEAILRKAIIDDGGPNDWAMPYWNYSDTNNPTARELPPAFSQQLMPDNTPNPLFVSQRYGNGSVPFELNSIDVNLSSVLQESDFISRARITGFGGPETNFHHSGVRGGIYGALESQPHNIVHVEIGGRNPSGLMTDPDTAALDPIFWLHHANIDRLWEVWLRRSNAHQNPTKSTWLNGPLSRKLVVPRVNGQDWEFTPQDMLITTAPDLDYEYDDISDPLQGSTGISVRFRRLRTPLFQPFENADDMEREQEQQNRNIELVGADNTTIELSGKKASAASAQVQLDMRTMNKVNRSFRILSNSGITNQEPDRIFLNVENIRSSQDGAVIDVYLNPTGSDNFSDYSNYYAGTIAFFGVRKASSNDEPQGGNGVTQVFDITKIIDELYLSQELNLENIQVKFVNRYEIASEDNATVGGISIYRQGLEIDEE